MHLTDWMQFLLGVANALLPIFPNPRIGRKTSIPCFHLSRAPFLPLYRSQSTGFSPLRSCNSFQFLRPARKDASHHLFLAYIPLVHLTSAVSSSIPSPRIDEKPERMVVNGRRRRRRRRNAFNPEKRYGWPNETGRSRMFESRGC